MHYITIPETHSLVLGHRMAIGNGVVYSPARDASYTQVRKDTTGHETHSSTGSIWSIPCPDNI